MVIPSASFILRTIFPSCPLESHLGLIDASTFRHSNSFCADPHTQNRRIKISPKTAFLTHSPDFFQSIRMVLPLRPRVKIFIWIELIFETATIIDAVRLYFSLGIEYIIIAESI